MASEIENLLLIKKPSIAVKVNVKHADLESYNKLLNLKTGEN